MRPMIDLSELAALPEVNAYLERNTDRTDSGCWEWSGARAVNGYGRALIGSRQVAAHRLSFTVHTGPIPTGLFICHRCDNPPCINPAHLFAGTAQENVSDREAKGRHPHRQSDMVRGIESHLARLTEPQVLEIRRRCARGESQQVIAADFRCSPQNVSDINRRKSWKHLPAEVTA